MGKSEARAAANESLRFENLQILVEGDPAEEIVRYGRDAGIDLIVMGTHGRTGLERLLMGSVAEKVLRDAPCSVMVVKLPRVQPVTSPGEVAVAATK